MLKETFLVIVCTWHRIRAFEGTSRGELCHACASQQDEMNFVNPEQCSPNLFLKTFRQILHKLPRQPLQYFSSLTIRNFPFIPHLNLSCSILGPLLCVPSIGKKQARLLHQFFNAFLISWRLLPCLPILSFCRKIGDCLQFV